MGDGRNKPIFSFIRLRGYDFSYRRPKRAYYFSFNREAIDEGGLGTRGAFHLTGRAGVARVGADEREKSHEYDQADDEFSHEIASEGTIPIINPIGSFIKRFARKSPERAPVGSFG
jgi:hypothetical protein